MKNSTNEKPSVLKSTGVYHDCAEHIVEEHEQFDVFVILYSDNTYRYAAYPKTVGGCIGEGATIQEAIVSLTECLCVLSDFYQTQ